MNTAMMEASVEAVPRTEVASRAGATSRAEAALPVKDGRYQAMFWRSPFAVAAAVLVSTQLSLIALAGAGGDVFPYQVTLVLTGLSASLLAAGIWPDWNYLAVTDERIDQQAGLRSLRVAWSDVQHVRVLGGWVELRVVTGTEPGTKKVRTRRVFNRYELSAEAFGDLVEGAWLRHRA